MIHPDGDRSSQRGDRVATSRSARIASSASTCRSARGTRAASARRRQRLDRDRRRLPDLSVRDDRRGVAGSQVSPASARLRGSATARRCANTSASSARPARTKSTAVGDDCLLLAYVHIAHNCVVGNGVTMSNLAQLAGHVRGRRLRDDRRHGRRPPVHAHRALRDGRRREQDHQGRSAVLPDRRQSGRAVRPQQRRVAPRGFQRRRTQRNQEASTRFSTIRSSTFRKPSRR